MIIMKSKTMTKVWFITGSSRGLGRSLTTAVLANGGYVAATARNPEQLKDLVEKYPGQIFPIRLDVTDYDDIYQSVADAVAHFGRIDVLVNNAGFGIVGAAEAFTDRQLRSQLETNLYAPIEITRAVLPYMRALGSGRILQISSVDGRVGGPGLTMYQAAKFGLSGFTEALSKEIAPLGIYATCIEPGGFRTDWAGESMTYARQIEDYENTVGTIALNLKSGNYMPMGDPDKAAQVMIGLAEHPEPPVHLILGSEAIGIVKRSEAAKMAELEKWAAVSISTDHDEAIGFLHQKQRI